MPNLYRNESSYPKVNAQRNLSGRTHYVDDDTLRFHHSRVLSCHITDSGLLLAIVCSDSLNYQHTKRGFRYTIFDVFGTAQERQSLDEAHRTKAQCLKAMWNALNKLDAREITLSAINTAEHQHDREMGELRATVLAIPQTPTAVAV